MSIPLEKLRHELEERLSSSGFRSEDMGPPAALELACFGAWLILSDGFALLREREAFEKALIEELWLDRDWVQVLLQYVFSLKVEELPPPATLLQQLVSQADLDRSCVIRCLLRVASADGSLHHRELAMIERLGYTLGLSATDLEQPFQEAGATETALRGVQLDLANVDRLSIGRSQDNAIQLPGLSVSRHHARLLRHLDRWWIEDLSSDVGTRVNGRQVERLVLSHGDLVQIENFCFKVDLEQQRLILWDENHLLLLSAQNLQVEVRDIQTGGTRSILDGVSCSFSSGQLVAIIGPSGCGKTTFINSLLGKAPKARGSILLNGRRCRGLLPQYAHRVGIVPQDDLLHSHLTVKEALFFSGALRAVADVTNAEIEAEVERVIQDLGLESIRRSRIGSPDRRGISGGERKRVNLGQELLNPATRILILDEPTTGLDPHTGLEIFKLLRQLADQGRIVLVVTHRVDAETLSLFDRILVLGTGGHRAYFGPPSAALRFFQSASVPELFGHIREQEAARRFRDQFDQSHRSLTVVPLEQSFFTTQTEPWDSTAVTPETASPRGTSVQHEAKLWWRQLRLGIHRYGQIKRRDMTAVVVHLAQVPLIVLACWLFLQNTLVGTRPWTDETLLVVPGALPFILVIAAFWLGCVSSIREIVDEQAIFRRERRAGLRVMPYLMSKVIILGGLAVVQGLLLVAATEFLFDFSLRHVNLLPMFAILAATALVGVASGLCVSALFRTSESAIAALPILVIPQLLCGGVLVPFNQMPEQVEALTMVAASRWAIEGAILSGSTAATGAGGQILLDECTHFTIPGSGQACRENFLELLGLAARTADSTLAQPMGSYHGALHALLLMLIFFSLAAAGILYGRRDLR